MTVDMANPMLKATIREKLDGLEKLDAAIVQLREDLAFSAEHQNPYDARVKAIGDEIAAIRTREYRPGSDAAGYPILVGKAEDEQRFYDLRRELELLQADRTRWIEAHTFRSAGGATSYTVDDVNRRLQRCLKVRKVCAEELDGLLAQISPGERLGLGLPAPDYAEHTARTAALRQSSSWRAS